jgi:hypothetical protein
MSAVMRIMAVMQARLLSMAIMIQVIGIRISAPSSLCFGLFPNILLPSGGEHGCSIRFGSFSEGPERKQR